MQRCDSFLHLHLGIDATGLPSVPSEAFPAQWAVVKDWKIGVDAPRNLVRVSIARSRMRERPQPPAHARVHEHAQSRARARKACDRAYPGARLGGLAPRPQPRARGRPRDPCLHARHRAVCDVGAACSRRRLGGATARRHSPRLLQREPCRPQAQALGGTPRSGGGSRARGQPCHSEPSGRPRHGHH